MHRARGEVVQDGVNGRLLPGEASPEEFCAAVQQAVADPDKVEEWSAAAGRTALDFSREKCAARMVDLYESLEQAASRHDEEEFNPWATLLDRLKAEWDLISEKTNSLIEASDEDSDEADLR